MPQVPVGATWRCIDLHLHTPGVTSFELPTGVDVNKAADRERMASDYVQRLVDAGIEIAAITDYQGVRLMWFQLIRERAKSAGIVVLPGAEMSIGEGAGKGLHLLLVCGPDTEPSRVADAIRHHGKSPDPLYPETVRAKHQDLKLRRSLRDALKDIRDQLRCAVIAAHASSTNGLLQVLGAQQAAELICDGLIDTVDQCESVGANLLGTGMLTKVQISSLRVRSAATRTVLTKWALRRCQTVVGA